MSHHDDEARGQRERGEAPRHDAAPSEDAARPRGHTHPHAHSHGSAHREGEASRDPAALARRREDLPRGAGAGKLLFFDAFAGIAGDMTVAALVDLGVPWHVVEDALGALGLPGVNVHLGAGFAGPIHGASFHVEELAPQPERSHAEIAHLLAAPGLTEGTQTRARRAFEHLARAEAAVHGVPVEEVHFHEVGAVDSIVDVVAAAACLDWLGARLVVSPLPMGRGTVTCRHGVLPLPAPATLACLHGVPTFDAGLDAELVTPTGAALVGALADGFTRWPSFAPERIGWGLGSCRLPDRPNALRAVLGAPTGAEGAAVVTTRTHALIEATMDDATGELLGHAVDLALAAGALDAWLAPVTMKKSRPGIVLSVLARAEDAERLSALVLTETTTLGLRITEVVRRERPRRLLRVSTRFGTATVKVSEGPYGPPQLKPELDDCRALASAAGAPLREVLAAVLAAARDE